MQCQPLRALLSLPTPTCAACGQVTDAGRIFVRLAGRVSEGEVGFGSEAVGMPATSIRQQAIR
jgi:hypothetical protein